MTTITLRNAARPTDDLATGQLIRGDLVLLDRVIDAGTDVATLQAVTGDGRELGVRSLNEARATEGEGAIMVVQLDGDAGETGSEGVLGDPWYCRIWPWLC